MNVGPLILPYEGTFPRMASPLAYAGEGSSILGRVTIGRNAWLGALTVLRADGHDVTVGDDFHLGARSTLHIAQDIFPCIVGDRVAVGENACVHACVVGNDVIIGDGTVILDGAVVDDHVIFEPGSTVFPGKRIAGGQVYGGSPAKPVRALKSGEIDRFRASMLHGRAGTRIGPRHRPSSNSQIDPSVFIAATASVKGRIVAAPGTSIFFSNDFDAGSATIEIGERTNIQDNTVIRCSGEGFRIGPGSTIGHNVLLHDCVIGSRSLIGIGAAVARGTIVEDHVLLAASARTEPGQVLESGFLYVGNPARKLAPLDRAKREMIDIVIEHYCIYARFYQGAQREPAKA